MRYEHQIKAENCDANRKFKDQNRKFENPFKNQFFKWMKVVKQMIRTT